METNEIMNNEEVMETATEEIVKASSGKGVKVAAGIGLAVLAGVVIYRYVGKSMIAKIKAQKEQQMLSGMNPKNQSLRMKKRIPKKPKRKNVFQHEGEYL